MAFEEGILRKYFWPAALLLAAVYMLALFGGPYAVERLFERGRFDILNPLAGAAENLPLDYYTGQIENRVIGPVKSVAGGALFAAIACRYLLGAGTFTFAASVLAYYLLTRPEVLFYPPFGEAITAPFYDAIWLLNNNLDYLALQKQETFTTGGPLVYPTSLWPLATAALMKLMPSPQAFIFTAHLLYFALGAGVIAIARAVYLKFFDPLLAMLGAVLLLSLPVNQAIVELINMEIPCVFFSVLAVHVLIGRRMGFACLWALLGLFMKDPAGAVCGAVFVSGVMLFFIEEKRTVKLKALGFGALTLAAAAVKFYVRSKIIGEQTPNNTVSLLLGSSVLAKMAITWVFLAALLAIAVILIRDLRAGDWRGWLNWHYGTIVMVMAAAFWFLLYLNFSVMSPRYKPLLAPFFLFCVFNVMFYVFKQPAVRYAGMALAILISFSCAFGWHHRLYVPTGPYGYNWLERSLEYRNMLKLQMRIARAIQDDFSGYIIGAPHVTAQSLGYLSMGYVNRPLEVMVYATRGIMGVRNLIEITPEASRHIVWVGFTHPWVAGRNLIKEGEDIILRDIWAGDRHAVIFTGGWEIEEMRREMVQNARRAGVLNRLKSQ